MMVLLPNVSLITPAKSKTGSGATIRIPAPPQALASASPCARESPRLSPQKRDCPYIQEHP